MPKHVQALMVCIPYKPEAYQAIRVTTEVMEELCRRLEIKSAPSLQGSYVEGKGEQKGYYSHYLVYAEELPANQQLERWTLEILQKYHPSRASKKR